jgi:DNA primase
MNLNDCKDKIKEVPISEIIGNFINLQKKGANYSGLCPFHQDTHPSLIVNDAKGLFRCFACNTGGDAIAFVERYKNSDFIQAVRDIMIILGYPAEIWEFNNPKGHLADPKKIQAYDLMNKAQILYADLAQSGQHSPYNHFLSERKISLTTAKELGLGFVPSTNPLTQYLNQLPFHQKSQLIPLALELGLIRPQTQNKFLPKESKESKESKEPKESDGETDQQSFYDTFNYRVVFPIWDHLGRVVGFSGRALGQNQRAKYINSQESLLFHKKNILYGFHLAKNFIKEKNAVILVEGQMDFLALYQAGFKNTVAVMGVALGDFAIRKIKDLTHNIFLALDSDQAGLQAMKRMNVDLLHQGLIPKTISFLPHKDPDEYLMKLGTGPLEKNIQEASIFVDRMIQDAIEKNPLTTIEKKIELLQEIFNWLSPLKENLWALEKISTLPQLLQLQSDAPTLVQKYKEYLQNKEGQSFHQLKSTTTVGTQQVPPENGPSTPIISRPRPISRAEKLTLTELIRYPAILSHGDFTFVLDRIPSPGVKRLVLDLKNLYFEVEESEFHTLMKDFLLGEKFDLEIRGILANTFFSTMPEFVDDKVQNKLLRDITLQLELEKLLMERDQLKEEQKNCHDFEKREKIIVEINAKEKQLQNLKLKRSRPNIDIQSLLN